MNAIILQALTVTGDVLLFQTFHEKRLVHCKVATSDFRVTLVEADVKVEINDYTHIFHAHEFEGWFHEGLTIKPDTKNAATDGSNILSTHHLEVAIPVLNYKKLLKSGVFKSDTVAAIKVNDRWITPMISILTSSVA